MPASATPSWQTIDLPLPDILRRFSQPLEALARADVPAIVLRRVLQPAACAAILHRLLERGLIYDPREPVPQHLLAASVREGGYQRIREPGWMTGHDDGTSPRRRIDVGTSLGNLGSDPERFFAHARQTHELFAHLFDGLINPISVLYDHLQRLASGKRVITAREPDGRLYGPAIFRVHYRGYTYGPHFDSVRLREDRRGYAVYRFDHQLAGVLCLQNSTAEGRTAQCILHRCLWQPELAGVIDNGTFHDYAAERRIEHVRVDLEPGDLYFFNTRLIHEVPGVPGDLPRAVLATFIGYSTDDPEVYVWS